MNNICDLLNFVKWQLLASGVHESITERVYYGSKYGDILTKNDNLYYVYWNDIHRGVLKKFLLGTFGTTNEDYREFIEFLNQNYADGRFYYIRCLDGNVIKTLIPREEDYRCFKAEFLDIIMPYLIKDTVLRPFLEGPYEYGNVKIREGANVLDLGANFGLFSALASSRGANVYAFEGTPDAINNYLLPLSQESANINVAPCAVSHQTGDSYFIVNDTNSSCNHLTEENVDGNAIRVPTMSVDDFVVSRHLEHLDFIKADIEGAERLMLSGAKENLREYAPDLSICYYHKLDDEKVLTDLILSANPDYEITKVYKKIYAHS